jgi:hypothetical protein
MKKLIIILLMGLMPIFACEYEDCPLCNVEVGEMNDYYFENNIEIDWIGDAMLWSYNIEYIADETDYWQLPEETYESRTGDCEDFCIMFMYLMKTKLNLETNLIMIEKDNGDVHTLVYPVPFGSEKKPMYYEAVNNFLSSTLLNSWHIKFTIPYTEVMWMTYNYHNNIGIYY